jgi:hypothetical protein
MVLTKELKIAIMDINLECFKDDDKEEAIIIVDKESIDEYLHILEKQERYEDCQLILTNINKLLLHTKKLIPKVYFY